MTDKDLTLHMHDLFLLATASHYDLQDAEERKRSAHELVELFFRLCKVLQPDLFIEAGAKDASSSRRASSDLRAARIVAFEANPYTYAKFRGRNPPESAVEYLHLALSDAAGDVTFNVRKTSRGTPRPDGHGSLMERGPSYEYDFEPVTVTATTLDTFFAESEFHSCAAWIDVEGAAGAVLSGGEDVLDKASVAIVEVEDRELWQQAWMMPDVAGFLYDRGMVPVARDFEYRYQYNMVFVRKALLGNDDLRLRLAQHLSATGAGWRADPARLPPDGAGTEDPVPARGNDAGPLVARSRLRRWLDVLGAGRHGA